MVLPQNQVRRATSGGSLVTIVVVVMVIAGVLGWAVYDSQSGINVRQVPTERIAVPGDQGPRG